MKMPDCIEAYRILALLAAGALVAGCGSGDISSDGGGGGCASTFSVPDTFEQKFENFTIKDLKEDPTYNNPAQANIEKTLFRQFLKAVKPASGQASDADDIYAFMSQEIDSVAHFGDTNNLPAYNSVRNDFDLIEAMVTASGQFEPLQLARDAMASCARDTQQALDKGEDGSPGSVRISDITVTEKSESDSDEGDSWSYFVNYAHNAKPLDDTTPFGPNIARLIFGPNAIIFTLYELEAFTGNSPASGFKQPGKLIAGFNATVDETLESEDPEESSEDSTDGDSPSQPSIFFESFPLKDTQDDRGQERGKTDRWEWSFSEGAQNFKVDKNGKSVSASCIRVTRDYASDSTQNQVKVEMSAETCPRLNEVSKFQADRDFNYTPANPNTSQTR